MPVQTRNAQIGYPTRSPKKVSKTSILRIGIVRFLVPGMFLKFCPAVVLYHCSTVYGTSIRLDDGTTILLRAHTPRVSASSPEAQHPCANTSADCTKPERVAPEGCDERVMIACFMAR